jgi:hypothetical protein
MVIYTYWSVGQIHLYAITVITLKTLLFAGCQLAHQNRSMRESHESCWGGRIKCLHCRWTVQFPKCTARTWLQNYQRLGQVVRRRGPDLRCVSRAAQDGTFAADVLSEDGILRLLPVFLSKKRLFWDERSRYRGMRRCNGRAYWRTKNILFNICWKQFRSQVVLSHILLLI